MPTAKDLTGQKFGRLTAVKIVGRAPSRHVLWECQCECGKVCITSSNSLLMGKTQSCGCLFKELLIKRDTKHGMSYTRLHEIWRRMKQRCSNPKTKEYQHYGGRGIRVCDEWNNDFEAFATWALNNDFQENAKRGDCTIDRIDVNGNYEPSNCRWVSQKVQCNNKRNNKVLI